MEPFSFTCACCGKEVTELPDLSFASPLAYHELPEAERAERTEINDDFCVIDGDQRFIRAVCPIPIVGSDQIFAWGIWVSLSEENFARYAKTFDDNKQSSLGTMFGWLCNRIPAYPDTLHLQTTVDPQDDRQRPFVWINQANSDHLLYREQRKGITRARLGEIYGSQVCGGEAG